MLSAAYSYRTDKLPRYEELVIASASTEDAKNYAYFAKSAIDYGPGGCVNTKAGSNRTTLTSARLTGDVAAGVLSGESIPDSALFVLAPDGFGRLPRANRELSATQLQLRYWRRGRAAATATVECAAPPLPPNTPAGALPVYGVPLAVLSVRPQRTQAGISGRLPWLATLAPEANLTTNLGTGAALGQAVLTLRTRAFTCTAWLPTPTYTTPAPVPSGRAFSDGFGGGFS